jgi:hypothetical protein
MVSNKIKNMKQLLSLFLFLLPCLALAQYPTNGNQKITLGEQTTADGLIYRGVLADTGIITPSSDTSAYIILDTVNHRFYNYNRATNVWSVTTIGSISSGLTGTLPVANGGTNRTTMPNGYILHGDGSAVDTAIGLFWDRTTSRLGLGTNTPSSTLNLFNNSSAPVINIANGVVPISTSQGGVINLYLGGTGSATGNYAVTNSILGRITFSGYGNNFFYQGAEINSIVSVGGNIDRSDHVVDLQFLFCAKHAHLPARFQG